MTTYRYPQVPPGGVVTARLAGPEQVFRLRIARPVANFGVVITSRARGVAVEPRVVVAGDESRLTGYPALPFNLNPYLEAFGERTPVAGAIRPLAGRYDVVFDSRTAAGAGAFTFRFWVDDVTPPKAQLLTRSVRRGQAIRVRLGDTGSGVDRSSLLVTVDGRFRSATLAGGVVRIATAGLSRGRHVLRLQASDYQETRNMENVARILPNTRVLRAVRHRAVSAEYPARGKRLRAFAARFLGRRQRLEVAAHARLELVHVLVDDHLELRLATLHAPCAAGRRHRTHPGRAATPRPRRAPPLQSEGRAKASSRSHSSLGGEISPRARSTCDAHVAAVEVVVDETHRLHERVHGGRADESPPPALEILGERLRLRSSVPSRAGRPT